MKIITERDIIKVQITGVIHTQFGRYFLLDDGKPNKGGEYWVIPDKTELFELQNGKYVALYLRPRWVRFIDCPMIIDTMDRNTISALKP